MTLLTGTFETAHASKYLRQLCKHFQHKVAATFDDRRGQVALPCGETTLSASDTHLMVTIDLEGADAAARGRHVIDSHLERFAFRDNFTSMDWDN